MFYLKKFTHLELVKAMEQAVLDATGVAFSFRFELALDGNTDLYIEKPLGFTRQQVETLADRGWFDYSLLEELEGETNLDPFLHEDELNQTHKFFQFILEKTFGKGANIAGVEVLDDVVVLNIAIPV